MHVIYIYIFSYFIKIVKGFFQCFILLRHSFILWMFQGSANTKVRKKRGAMKERKEVGRKEAMEEVKEVERK